MINIGYYNGETGPIEDMKIPMNDRVVYFGDGVYDATYTRNHIPYALEDHIDRFYNSCKLLKIDINIQKDDLKALIRSLALKVDSPDQFVYWSMTRGTAMRAHQFPKNAVPNLLIFCKPTKMADVWKPVSGITVEDKRYYFCNVKTLNLIPNCLAQQEAVDRGCDIAIFHRSGRVTECAHSNIHIIKNGVFRTAPLDELILPGIGRKHLLQIAKENNIPVVEEPFTVEEMMNADEVFESSSGCLGIPFYSINGTPVGGKATEIMDLLRNKYQERVSAYISANS